MEKAKKKCGRTRKSGSAQSFVSNILRQATMLYFPAQAAFFAGLSELLPAGQAPLSAPQALFAGLHSAFAVQHLPSLQQGHLQSSPHVHFPSWQQVQPSTQAHLQSSPHLQASPQQQALWAEAGAANHAPPGSASASAVKTLNRKFLRVFIVNSPLIGISLC